MPKLNEVLAIEKGVKTRSQRVLTDLHKTSQKADLYEGMTRIYRPNDEEGEAQPPTQKLVQIRARDMLRSASSALAELFDITATKDVANLHARADVVVGEATILRDVPVTTLLFLEKQLNDLDTFCQKIPALDPSVNWSWSDSANCYEAEKTWTHRTEKVPTPVVLHPATKEHPAQTSLEYRDQSIGRYETTRFSGALSATDKEALLERIATLKKAVKVAREQANANTAERVVVSNPVFDFLFQGI